MAITALNRGDGGRTRLRETMGELVAMDGPRQRYVGICLDWTFATTSGTGHPLLGRRMPDLDVVTADGPGGVHSCCTMPGRYCSISVSPAPSTSLHGRLGFNGSTLDTRVCGSSRCSARSLLPLPC